MAKDRPRVGNVGTGFREGWKGKPMPDGKKPVPPPGPAATVPREPKQTKDADSSKK